MSATTRQEQAVDACCVGNVSNVRAAGSMAGPEQARKERVRLRKKGVLGSGKALAPDIQLDFVLLLSIDHCQALFFNFKRLDVV